MNTEEYIEMPMTAKEAVRAMDWAVANGHTDKEARELVEYITGQEEPKGKTEEKEQTKE